MKKFGSILLTLAILWTLCCSAIPAYASDSISVTLTPYRSSLMVGQSSALSIYVSAPDSHSTSVSIDVGNSGILQYDPQTSTLTGLKKGTAVVTATATDHTTNEIATTSVTIKVYDSTGLINNVDYYLMNYHTGKLLALSTTSDTNGISICGVNRVNSAPLRCQWTVIKNSDGTIRLESVYSSTGRSAYVSGSNLILYNSTGARTKFNLYRVETGLYKGKYQIRYNDQYLYMNNSGTVALTTIETTTSYWTLMAVEKGNADLFSTYYSNTSDTFDTTINNHKFETNLSELGYRPIARINSTASLAYSKLTSDSFFVISSHGNAGLMAFYNDVGDVTGYILAYPHDQYNSIDSLQDNALASLRCVLYVGCSTGVDYFNISDTTYYNLVRGTYDKGAHFVLGTTEDTWTNQNNPWLDYFLKYALLGYNISDILVNADRDLGTVQVPDGNGGYTSVTGFPYYIVGDTGQYLD